MYFILQYGDKDFKDTDIHIIKNILDDNKRIHDYKCTTYNELDNIISDENIPIKDVIPIGSIKFIRKFLKNVYGIEKMNCIEVPKELRKYKYLKRSYSILEKNDLPKSGYYFLKYASELKDFSYIGLINFLPKEDLGNDEPYLKEGLYVVSEHVDILSEYRCFILEDKIEGIQFYNGDCTIMPTPKDIELLKEMVREYKSNPNRPKAYTLDVAMIKDRGLGILECHPHTSVGLYGFNSFNLPYFYTYGLDWYISNNNELETFSNF